MFSLFFTAHHPAVDVLLDLCFGWIFVYSARIIWRHFRTVLLLSRVPGPRAPSWIWGSELEIHRSAPGSRYIEWKKQFGDIFKLKGAFGRNNLIVADYRAATHILGDHVWEFPKPAGVREWFRLLAGEGLLVVEGKEAHARQRRILTPALNQTAIRPLLPLFYRNAMQVVNEWTSRIEKAPDDFITEDVQWWSNRFSLDTIGSAGFSYDFASLSGVNNPLAHVFEALANSSDNFSAFAMKALFWTAPWILSIPSEKGKRIRETREELGKVAKKMWSDAKASGEVDGKTLMSSMIKADRKSGEDAMSEEEIASQLRTLVQAGYEPVSSAIPWALYELARHPELQENIRQEVSATLGDPSYDDLLEREKLPLLDAFVKESLRLHPPVLELSHIAAKDSIVPLSRPLPGTADAQFVIPAGTIINIPVNILQTDPKIWGPDAAEFRPERWLRKEESEKTTCQAHIPQELMAFSYGPRKCPGRTFATIEIKALLAVVLRQFTLRTVPDRPIQSFWSFVVRARVEGEKDGTLPLQISKVNY